LGNTGLGFDAGDQFQRLLHRWKARLVAACWLWRTNALAELSRIDPSCWPTMAIRMAEVGGHDVAGLVAPRSSGLSQQAATIVAFQRWSRRWELVAGVETSVRYCQTLRAENGHRRAHFPNS